MRVIKEKAAGYQNVNGATGSTGATYAAVTESGEVVARFRPSRVRGYGRADARVWDASGRRLQILPALYEGALQIRDAASGRLLLHRPIEPGSRGGLHLDLDAEGIDPAIRQLEILQRTYEGTPGEPTGWWLD